MVIIMIGDNVMCIYLGFRVIDRLGLEAKVTNMVGGLG